VPVRRRRHLRCQAPERPPARFRPIGSDASAGALVNRYYDPGTGQFLSVDPLVDETDQAYGYTGGDPVDETDPTGKFQCADTSPGTCENVATEGILSALIGAAVGAAVSGADAVCNIVGLCPTKLDGGEVDLPICFGQPRIGPFFGNVMSLIVPSNGTTVEVFMWHGQVVAINNRTLANDSLSGVKNPAIAWVIPTKNQLNRLAQTCPLTGPLPSLRVVVTASPYPDCDPVSWAGPPVVRSNSYVRLAQ
jgi:RHS repeat-associated protein